MASSSLTPEVSPPPDPPDPPAQLLIKDSVDDHGTAKENLSGDDSGLVEDIVMEKGASLEVPLTPKDKPSTIATFEPFSAPSHSFNGDECILFLDSVSLSTSYDVLMQQFETFGYIKEIRLKLTATYKAFQVWVVFSTHKEALDAFSRSTCSNVCMLVNCHPKTLDVYYPSRGEDLPVVAEERSPLPATWLIAVTKGERGNLYKLRKLMRHKAGGISNAQISRFGKNSFLIHANSPAQGAMIANLNIANDDMLKEIKIHYTFSYPKGVVFNQDLCELTEAEILEMCTDDVWKVHKIPRSNLVVFTFNNERLPPDVIIERERLPIRPYKQRPLQCFHCYGFGHASRKCTRNGVCANCSHFEHGDCENPEMCVNCKEAHNAKDRNCVVYRKEQEAILKASSEKISIGHAKRLLSKPSYSNVLQKKTLSSVSVTHKSPKEISHPSSRGAVVASSDAARASSGAPQPSSEAAQASLEAPGASFEASQSDSLPELGATPKEGLTRVPVVAQVHNSRKEEAEALRNPKRQRTPSPSLSRSDGARRGNCPESSGGPSESGNRSRKSKLDKGPNIKPNLKRGSTKK